MGGLEIQAHRSAGELRRIGWEVEFLSPETRDLGDLVHFFGTYDSYWDVVLRVRERCVPYVISPVFLPPTFGWKLGPRGLRKKIFDRTSHRNQRKTLENAARIIVLSQMEASALRRFYGEVGSNLQMVPNGVEERFFDADPEPFRQYTGVAGPFALCTGRVEKRKNQLALARAARQAGVSCLFIGSEQDAEYVAACKQAGGSNVRFLGEMASDSILLPSAYAACSVFALVSHTEVLSLSALEAACSGASLVLSDGWGAKEHFNEHAQYVSSNDVGGIAAALGLAIERGRSQDRAQQFATEYCWSAVASNLDRIYREVLA